MEKVFSKEIFFPYEYEVGPNVVRERNKITDMVIEYRSDMLDKLILENMTTPVLTELYTKISDELEKRSRK